MITQILAIVVAFTMVHFLLRLRHFILAHGKDKLKYCRAYIIGFDEADWDSDRNDNSDRESDSEGATKLSAASYNLVKWPTELDLQIESPGYVTKLSAEDHAETTGVPKPDSASKSRAHNITAAVVVGISLFFSSSNAKAQTAPGTGQDLRASSDTSRAHALIEEIQQMRRIIERLEARVAQLEAGSRASRSAAGALAGESTIKDPVASRAPSTDTAGRMASSEIRQSAANPAQTPTPTDTQAANDRKVLDFFRDTTVSATLDGYYGYNFNRPVGRINLLRAYDVSSNSFSLNQAVISVERAPNVDAGRRFGMRLDLMYGQATETLQGNAANEPRPQVYRPIWQAYGTYVAPVGKGLTLDFGKFASSLGYETNFTKDNFNYSRSYYFNYLPFYHFGLRAKYPINDKLTVMYHLMNGTQQSEDFNKFKSQHVALILTPTKKVSWQVNYYVGREQREVAPQLNPTFASLPTQPGLSTEVIRPELKGRFHVLDTYVTWLITDKLTLAAEADYVINRVQEFSPPSRVTGGAAYARYQFTPKFAMTGRAEYLSDSGGLFSGVTQALKETTLTFDYKLADGLLMRGEWRRDFSNQPFFLTNMPGVLKKEQNTVTLGLVWWFGKEGSW